ncbi:MAG: acyltransferase [Phycisphaeraceae bacterium]|nr:acyltransferase [Phycisphaeraceae bacterium]
MQLLKILARTYGTLRALPTGVAYAMGRRVMGRERAWLSATESLAGITGWSGVYARQAFYRWTLEHVGVDVYVGFMSMITKPQARLGDRVYVGRFCTVGWSEIGDDVKLADGVQVLSGGRHHLSGDDEVTLGKVTIGRGAWLGAGAIVMADVGDEAVVGAGAVVTRAVAPRTRVAGSPARPIDVLPSMAA